MKTMDKNFVLSVGQSAVFKQVGMFKPVISVINAGMPNESTYSIVVNWEYGSHAYAYNLYLSADQKEVEIPKGRLIDIQLDKENIKFRYQS